MPGSATTLIDQGDSLKPEVRADLPASIREEAERLHRYGSTIELAAREDRGAGHIPIEDQDLAIAKGCIQAMNGHITACSPIGREL